MTIFDYSTYSPAMHPDIADGTSEGWAWTAQVDPSDSSCAFSVSLYDGSVDWSYRDDSGLVRACREVAA